VASVQSKWLFSHRDILLSVFDRAATRAVLSTASAVCEGVMLVHRPDSAGTARGLHHRQRPDTLYLCPSLHIGYSHRQRNQGHTQSLQSFVLLYRLPKQKGRYPHYLLDHEIEQVVSRLTNPRFQVSNKHMCSMKLCSVRLKLTPFEV